MTNDRGPKNILHTGDDLKKVGGPDSCISYGSAWAKRCHVEVERGLLRNIPAPSSSAGEEKTAPSLMPVPTLPAAVGADQPVRPNFLYMQPFGHRNAGIGQECPRYV